MLRKLVLHGFKSFSQKTDIALGRGVTAIVGPNGCGKSNIADALRWVLGEQNPRLLRSSKQEDVIFTGTSRKKAMGMAEVRLLFDGIEGDHETEIIRRYTRDGSSHYSINGKACRLKDIVEILSGTGLSHTGYVVIGQGVIQDLVTSKPEDRRVWIEEASGVSRVRLGEKEMERRLSTARSDLQRLDDLLREISSQESRLFLDREATRKYQKLKEEQVQIEISLSLSRYDEEKYRLSLAEKRLSRYIEDRAKSQDMVPRIQEEIARLLEEEKRIKTSETTLSQNVEQGVGRLLELEKHRDSLRGQIRYIGNEIESRAVRKTALLKEIQKNAESLETLTREKEKSESLLEDVSSRLSEIDQKRARSLAAYKELSQNVLNLRENTVSLTEQLGVIRREKDDIWRRLDSVRSELSNLRRQLSENRDKRNDLSTEISSEKEKLLGIKNSCHKLEEELKCLEAKEREEQKELDRLVSSEKSLGAKITAILARKKLLSEMEHSFEGYASGPRTVLEAHSRGSLKGIYGSVLDLIQCDERYISALSAALGGSVENIVTENEEVAKNAIAYLRQKRSGRATFLPLSVINPRSMHPRASSMLSSMEGVRALSSVVNFDKSVSKAILYLLGRVVLADNIDIALDFMKRSRWTTRVVTLAGEVVDSSGAMTGGQAPRQEALFRRKQELLQIDTEEKIVSRNLADILSKRTAKTKDLEILSLEVRRVRKGIQDLNVDITRLEETLATKQSMLSSLIREIESKSANETPLVEQEIELDLQLAAKAAQEEEIQSSIDECTHKLKEYEVKLKETADLDKESIELARSLSVEKESLQREVSNALRRIEGLRGERISLTKNLQEEKQCVEERKANLQKVQAEENAISLEIESLENKVSNLKKELASVIQQRRTLISQIEDGKTRLERLDSEVTSLTGRIEDTEKHISHLKSALSETVLQIRREFNLKEPYSPDIPRAKREEVAQRLEEIDASLTLLGNVNLKAEQEYSTLSQRLSMLTQERDDVVAAIEELEKASIKVRETMEKRFHETFSQVRDKFEIIFRELFGGGRGTLELCKDTLGVEIHAEPPGRKQKQINLLSGGERSLCGLALIFAIIAVHPSPLIVLDEVDTALDDSNVVRFGQYLRKYSENTQFLVITHQKATMEAADILYGVTMEEPGVSTVYSMRLQSQEGNFLLEGVSR